MPGKKVLWHVEESNLNYTQDKAEWKSTDITFKISKKGDKTQVRFTHVGLVPQFECYGSCSNARGSLVSDNLRNLITTGQEQTAEKKL